MWTIAKLAYKELLYKRIFLIAILMSVAYLLLYGVATLFAADQASQDFASSHRDFASINLEYLFLSTQLLGAGLYLASFITVLLSILGSIGSISSEIESHHIDTILARPIHRHSIVLGKYIGLAGILAAYALFLFAGIIGINAFLGGKYLSVDLTAEQILLAGFLFMLQPLIVVAVSLFFSSRMTTINGGIIVIILYGISFIGGFIEQFGALFENQSLINIGIITSLLFPLDSLFRKMTLSLFEASDDPLSFASQGIFASASTPSDLMVGYALIYGCCALLAAIRFFGRRDL
ncbi:ABC transporter permease [Brevibacillus sp. SYSU BS000544]|uniref:ABC transporter permease n=1 Tax=Brevibacillus sp. SYSU BS000544 TaxID=3416443 RepID=UPI003CE51379